MSAKRVRTREVLVYLDREEGSTFFQHLRREGLFERDELAPHEADELRVAKLLMEDLGVNAAGVHVALHLRRRLAALEARTRELARALESRDTD